MKTNRVAALLMVACLLSLSLPAQINIKGKLNERLDRKIDQGLDKAEEAARKKDKKDNDETNNPDQNDENQPAEEGSQPQKPAQETKPGLQKYSKFDFVPGNEVIFYEDFSQDNIGDFPALWYTNKGGEVQTTNLYPGKWFNMKEEGMYYLEKGFQFPENFTMEFDIIPMVPEGIEAQSIAFDLTLLSTDSEGLFPTMYVPGQSGIVLNLSTSPGPHSFSGYKEGSYTINGDYQKESGMLKLNEINHISIWVQKSRMRLYMFGEKIFDIPKVFTPGHQLNQIRFLLGGEISPLITNIRIAKAGADVRSKLLTEGKIISYGIYFDSGKDIVKPESYGSLKEIASVLKENPTINIRIAGHTDADGDDSFNLSLSKKRAEAVKAALVKEFAIEPGRLETDGRGETQPLSPNTTVEGKAKNRRVEFLKI